MNYNASVTDFFKCPAWKNNLLLGAVAIFIPLVGPLVLFGWHITCLWARGNKEDPTGFPAFDFNFFSKYLERGLWPFLVNLVASLVLVPVILILQIPVFLLFIIPQTHSGHHEHTGLLIAAMALFFLVYMVVIVLFNFITTPLILRSIITQDFKAAFNLGFVKAFISLTWKEILGVMVFMLGLSLCMMVITIITCYIGMFFATPVFMFSWHHLQKQLYQLYLSRGGEAVPLSPKLNDLPPPLHA